jgi:predicted phosphoribosyltransferase
LVVLALPRGGLPVAREVAGALHASLDVFLVRKLGFPGHEEFAIGAIASGGVRVMNPAARGFGSITGEEIDAIAEREQRELERREALYRGDRPRPDFRGKRAVLVDDGLATGSTMLAAVRALRLHRPETVTVAVPVGSREAVEMLAGEADEVVCAVLPEPFRAVGEWYLDFTQTTDDEVQAILLSRAPAVPE